MTTTSPRGDGSGLPAFDYKSLSPAVATFLRGQAERIRRGYTASIVHAGTALTEAKRHISHGIFVKWVEAEVGLPARTAQIYMQVSQWAKGKSAIVNHLPPSVLYLLSARSTPDDFVTSCLDRVEAGERLELVVIREELKLLRESRRQVEAMPLARIQAVTRDGRKNRTDSVSSESPEFLTQAVNILAKKLSSEDFRVVRGILTSEVILRDPRLAANLAAAFTVNEHLDEVIHDWMRTDHIAAEHPTVSNTEIIFRHRCLQGKHPA